MSRVQIKTIDGQIFESDAAESPWDNSQIKQPGQPSDHELQEKFHWLASGSLSKSRATELEDKIWHCDALPDAESLTNLLVSP